MLSKTLIREAREPGKHRDDNNLYLVIPKARPAGGTWQFIYSIGGRSTPWAWASGPATPRTCAPRPALHASCSKPASTRSITAPPR